MWFRFVSGRDKFQSTHPHGVRPKDKEVVIQLCKVSIHAPTRGATLFICAKSIVNTWFQSTHPHGVRLIGNTHKRFGYNVSIHAPTRGATQCGLGSYPVMISFNPRTHTGCDIYMRTGSWWNKVSIHAPTRGATPAFGNCEGAVAFQSTHPHGVRLCFTNKSLCL